MPRPISSRTIRLRAGRVAQDLRRLAHLDHERRFAARQVVARADAREHAIADADARAARRDEAAHLRLDHRQRHLADQRRLARHVRAADDQDLLGARVQAHVVGDEAAGRRQPLDDGVARVGEIDHAAVVDLGAAVAGRWATSASAASVSTAATRAASASSRADAAATVVAQRREDLQLQRDAALVGGQDRLLELAQLGRHEALGVGDRLLAPVVLGHATPGARA